ncbi:MAG: hypothetical protein M1840_007876 [Geoglossum simile]|nr:MAG: hypothetical protein M1840_007876 [Geoglossum simile]
MPEHTTEVNKETTCYRGSRLPEYYFARIKGFPEWSCIISDNEMLPPMVRTRLITAKRLDGTYGEEYAPDGSKISNYVGAAILGWSGRGNEGKQGFGVLWSTLPSSNFRAGRYGNTIAPWRRRGILQQITFSKAMNSKDQERKGAKGKGGGKGKTETNDTHAEVSYSEAAVDGAADEMEFDENETNGKAKSKSKKRKKDAESEETSKVRRFFCLSKTIGVVYRPRRSPRRKPPLKLIPDKKLKLTNTENTQRYFWEATGEI